MERDLGLGQYASGCSGYIYIGGVVKRGFVVSAGRSMGLPIIFNTKGSEETQMAYIPASRLADVREAMDAFLGIGRVKVAIQALMTFFRGL